VTQVDEQQRLADRRKSNIKIQLELIL